MKPLNSDTKCIISKSYMFVITGLGRYLLLILVSYYNGHQILNKACKNRDKRTPNLNVVIKQDALFRGYIFLLGIPYSNLSIEIEAYNNNSATVLNKTHLEMKVRVQAFVCLASLQRWGPNCRPNHRSNRFRLFGYWVIWVLTFFPYIVEFIM